MKNCLLAFLTLLLVVSCSGEIPLGHYSGGQVNKNEILLVEASPQQGFNWPFLLYVPEKHGENLAVIPNNSGRTSDDFEFFKEKAVHELNRWISPDHDFICLMPIFPRFKERMGGNRIYTHALDRDSMTIAPESRIAITVHWQGKRLDPERSSISFNLDDLFVVQDNRLHRALACDRDPAERITGVTQFSRTFLFDNDFDITRSFTFLEYPYSIHVRNARLEEGKIINPSCVAGSGIVLTGVAETEIRQDTPWYDKAGSLIEGTEKLERLDLQLIAMTEAAGDILEKGLDIDIGDQFSLLGFSASAMFADRFCHLHPDMVKAAAYGSPGGLPMLPFDQLHGSLLPYPVGTGDLGKLTGREFDRDSFQKIHRFIYLGEKDQNDSVPYRDGFGKTASDLVFSLIGKTPLERHRFVGSILGTRGYQNTEFVYYPEIGHRMTEQTRRDMFDFLENRQK
mgnify:CR=1 FL=1